MAADNEHRLVSKVVRDRNIIPVLEQGIRDEWIVDDEVRMVWKFIREHYTEYKEVPSATVVKDNYPNFKLYDVQDSLDYLIDTMVTFRRRLLTKQGMEHALDKLQHNDHESALNEMSKTVTVVNEAGVKGTNHLDITKNSETFWNDYDNIQNHKLLGVPTGFHKIDDATAGLQGGQLITMIAPPKTGKSQICLQMAKNVWETGMVPMFQSFEMNNHEQSQRFYGMGGQVSSTRLRLGKLKDEEERRLKAFTDRVDSSHPLHFVDAINGLTIDSLLAKAEQLKPDILFVDGVYLMMDQVTGDANTPQALTNITRGLKRVAQRLNIPVVISTQTLLWKMKGGKVSADSIGYSSSFFQDSDVILGLEPTEEDDKIRLLRVVQSRNCPPADTSITWNWETGCFHDEDKAVSCKFCAASWITTP